MSNMDHHVSLNPSRSINANSRRPSVMSSPKRELLPRAAKRARTSKDMDPITPQATSSDLGSSPLSLPPMSEQPFALCESSIKDQPEIPLSTTKRGQQGLTKFTISEGDLRSLPQPGTELLRMVEDAKNRRELAMIYDASVVRRINGEWMAPQMCKSCQLDPKHQCDRQSPCSTCTKNATVCLTDGYMTKLRSRTLKTATQTSKGAIFETVEKTTAYPLMHDYVCQNFDGSWSSTSQDSCDIKGFEHPTEKPTRRRQSTIAISRGYSVTTDTTESESEQLKPRMSRSMKRKAHDDDFSISHDPNDNSDCPVSSKKLTTKSKSAGKAKAGARRVTVAAYHANNQLNKPEPHGRPEVWADKRQQLCETLRYFNAYQSGAYTNNGIAYGHLIDAEVDPRDKFDEQVVITSVGGGRSKDENNKSIRTTDQVKSTTATAFMRNKQLKIPVAIIAGQGNRISPSRLPHYYNFLGWFQVTDVWAEKCQGIISWRVRFEKICLTEKSWWAVTGSPVLSQGSTETAESQVCPQCDQPSKSIYNAGWACLHTECASYFHFRNGYNDSTLDYTEGFLKERSEYQGNTPGPLSEPLLTAWDMAQMDAFGFENAFKRGIVCPNCGCCSRRIAWDHWFCENSACDFTYWLKQNPISINNVLARAMDMDEDNTDPLKLKADTMVAKSILSSQTIHGHWDINEYKILGEGEEIIGFVRHFGSNGIINQQNDGPNDLFLQMQSGNFNLRRNPARQGGSTGEILTSHWAANWGAPYKYGVRQLSKGFDEAPAVILKAIKRLTWAGEYALSGQFESFEPFNECLSIGYFENTKIGFHDDGEKELGPTVATLSLGAKAVMSFRPKAKSAIGGPAPRNKGSKPVVLSITLEHGDIVVMHGRKIQQFYEHAVIPKGPLRYALTCRYVNPDKMVDESEAQDAIVKGTLPLGSEQYNYDGDINAVAIVPTASKAEKIVNDIVAMTQTGDLTVNDIRGIQDLLAIRLPSSITEPQQAMENSADVDMSDAAAPHIT